MGIGMETFQELEGVMVAFWGHWPFHWVRWS